MGFPSDPESLRREFLQIGSVTLAVGFAGCTISIGPSEDEDGTPTATETGENSADVADSTDTEEEAPEHIQLLSQELPRGESYITGDRNTLQRDVGTVAIDTADGTLKFGGPGSRRQVAGVGGYLAADGMEQMDSWGGEVAPADHRFGTNATFGSDEFAFEPGTFQGIAFNAREGATLVVDGEEVVTEARTVRYATDRGIFEIPTDDGGTVFNDDYSWSSVRGTWPQYRADSGNTAILSGVSHSQQEPTERWRFEVDPIGNADGAFATPVVADGTVYTVSNQNEARYIGDREEFFGSLYALDAETGERLWVANDVEYAFEAPAVVDGTVYARARDGTIRALAAEDGNVAWTIEAERRGDAVGTVAGETLYVTGSDRLLRAIDLSEAREAWRFQSDIRSHGGEQTARVAAVQSGTVYYATWPRESTGSVIKGYVHAVNVTSEEELWRQSVGGAVPGTVVATEALILVRRRHSDGKNTFTDVRALDPDNGDVVWTSDRETSLPISDGYVVTDEAVYTSESRLIADDVTPEPLVGSPVVAGDIAYLASGRIGRNPETTNNAYLTAFDLSAGGVLWEKELYTADDVENPFWEAANMPRDRPQLSTPSVVDNTAYIGAKTGTLYAFSWPA